MWVTLLDTRLSDAIRSMARCRLRPIVGGASNSTTPSRLVRKATWLSAVGDPVEVLLHPPDEVTPRVERRAERGRGNRGEVGQRGRRRRPGEGAPGQRGDRGNGRDRGAAREERAAVQRRVGCHGVFSLLAWRDWSLARSAPAEARSWARTPPPPRT